MIRDLDLSVNFEYLYTKNIYLYGAGEYGKQAKMLLDTIGIAIKGYIDKNACFKEASIFTCPILSPKEFVSISENRDILIIITTSQTYIDEIIQDLKNLNCSSQNVYSLLGLRYAIYFNLDKLDHSIQNKYIKMLEIWKYNQALNTLKKQASLSLYNVVSDSSSHIIFQPGKVGSNTLAATLKHYNIPVVHSHGLSYSCDYVNWGTNIKKILIDSILSSDKSVKMITLVRDPIAKDIGHFFQKLSSSEDDTAWFVKGIMEKNFQESFYNYLSIVTPYDFSSEQKKSVFNKKMVCHIDYIASINENGSLWGWYEEEFKNNLGIDLLSYEFNTQLGYSIIHHNNIELLVLQLEKLNDSEDILASFLGIENLKLINTNIGFQKSYQYLYKQFKKQVLLPRKYVDFCYNNKYMKHFYSQTDIDAFYKSWEKHITD